MKIVIPGDDPPLIQGSPHLERLRTLGEVTLYTDRPTSEAEQVRRAQQATVIVNSRSQVKWPGHLLRQLPDLRLLAICGIGTDAIDLETARAQGIVVCNIGGRTAPVVAEHALALMLAVARRAYHQTHELKQGRWSGRHNIVLRGKTLGLIGAGSIAQEMARLARAIGMNVLAWTFHPSPERAQQLGIPFVSLEDLLRTADVVSVHVKLTEQSRGLIGARELAWMKPGAILINTARGPIVDSAALVAALNSGSLEGAGLDVFEVEPLPVNDPLLACEQVVLTPHNADLCPEGLELLCGTTVDNVLAFVAGTPQNRVV